MIFSSDALGKNFFVVSGNIVYWKAGLIIFRAEPAASVVMIGAKFVVRQLRILAKKFAVFRSIWGLKDRKVGILQLNLGRLQCERSLRCVIFAEWRKSE